MEKSPDDKPLGDKTTLAEFLKKIAEQSGRAQRNWAIDQDIPNRGHLESAARGATAGEISGGYAQRSPPAI
jgi:hypothetical protein